MLPIPSRRVYCVGISRQVRDWSLGHEDTYTFHLKVLPRTTLTKLYDLFRPMADTLLSSSSEEEVQEKEKISENKLKLNDLLKEAIVKANQIHCNSCENELTDMQRKVYILRMGFSPLKLPDSINHRNPSIG